MGMARYCMFESAYTPHLALAWTQQEGRCEQCKGGTGFLTSCSEVEEVAGEDGTVPVLLQG